MRRSNDGRLFVLASACKFFGGHLKSLELLSHTLCNVDMVIIVVSLMMVVVIVMMVSDIIMVIIALLKVITREG
jgi:hypothetical protein